jgi:hypothetical protein
MSKETSSLAQKMKRAMNQNPSSSDGAQKPNHNLPPAGKGVPVRHNGLERIAYVDGQGNWRNYDTGDLLEGEVTILSFDLEP